MYMIKNHRLKCEVRDMNPYLISPYFFIHKQALVRSAKLSIVKNPSGFPVPPSIDKIQDIVKIPNEGDREAIEDILFTQFDDIDISADSKLTDYAVWKLTTESGRIVGLCPVALGWVLYRMGIDDPIEFFRHRMIYLPDIRIFLIIGENGDYVAGIMKLKLNNDRT